MITECNGAVRHQLFGEPVQSDYESTPGRRSPRDAGKELSGMRRSGSNFS